MTKSYPIRDIADGRVLGTVKAESGDAALRTFAVQQGYAEPAGEFAPAPVHGSIDEWTMVFENTELVAGAEEAEAEYVVDELEACEPSALTTSPAIRLTLTPNDRGFHNATVYGPTREAVVEYVRENWGDEDGDWFREWVEDRVEVTFGAAAAPGLDLAPDDPRLDDCERMVELWSDYLRATTDFERGYAQGRFEEYASQNAIDPDLFPALRFEAARRLDLCPGCKAAERDGIATTCGGDC